MSKSLLSGDFIPFWDTSICLEKVRSKNTTSPFSIRMELEPIAVN